MAKKKSSNKSISIKQADAQRRRDKKQNKNKEKSYDPEMKCQLEKIGLGLKEIPGDGNCLFRALADQLYGGQEGQKLHGRLRNETVKYMLKYKEDFEPFFASDEGLTFDRHLDLLSEDGTYAGNDAIVAFARRYEVVVVIHQLNEALWKIGEETKSTTPTSSSEKEKAELHNSKPAKHHQDREPAKSNKSLSKRMKQLHISYHNGDHYNSVRRIGDFGISGGGAANKPANVYIDTLKPDIQVNGSTSCNSDDESSTPEGRYEECSDYENSPGHILNTKYLNDLVLEVQRKTGITDTLEIHRCLEDNEYEVESTCTTLFATNAQNIAQRTRSTLWQEGGTGSRIFGDEVAGSAVSSRSSQSSTSASTSHGGRKRNNQRHKGRRRNDFDDNDDKEDDQPLAAMQALSI